MQDPCNVAAWKQLRRLVYEQSGEMIPGDIAAWLQAVAGDCVRVIKATEGREIVGSGGGGSGHELVTWNPGTVVISCHEGFLQA